MALEVTGRVGHFLFAFFLNYALVLVVAKVAQLAGARRQPALLVARLRLTLERTVSIADVAARVPHLVVGAVEGRTITWFDALAIEPHISFFAHTCL